MLTYITAFIFYTLAMIGILIGGFIIYKKTFAPVKNENKGIIKIIDSYSVAPKKTLMVVNVKNEDILIALDSERTTFLTKLGEDKKVIIAQNPVNTLNENETVQDNYDLEADIRQEIQEVMKERTSRFDDMRKTRSNELQKQFMELYKKDEPTAHNIQNDEVSKRKQMIRHLISELNSNKTAGSKF